MLLRVLLKLQLSIKHILQLSNFSTILHSLMLFSLVLRMILKTNRTVINDQCLPLIGYLAHIFLDLVQIRTVNLKQIWVSERFKIRTHACIEQLKNTR